MRLGVKCKVNIKKGQFIDKYIGEIITAEEANRRRKASSKSQSKDVYLFALDKFSDPNSLDPRLAGPAYEVDGEFCAGPTRFINHSCDPNVRIFARVGDHADKHIHDLAFFAIEDIPAQTELTFDYVDGEVDLIKDSQDPKTRGQMTRCLCKSKNCRGFLW
jgi:histone-lysine N-methyltransferase SUV39H